MTARPGRPLAGFARPLGGFGRFKVLDFSKLLPGPFATQLLADLGCRVTRVELPHFQDMAVELPPRIDGVGFAYWMLSRSKRRLVLDFRRPEGLKKLLDLVAGSDVLVEGFRPGLMDRIGLGYDALKRLNPGLVYVSLVGYRPDGPWGRKAGHDLNFMAASGLLGLGDGEGRISFPAAQIADVFGGLAAAAAVLAALLERATTRRGRRVAVAMADALHSALVLPLGYWAASGKEPSRGRPDSWWCGQHPFYRLYRTADGRHLAVAALERTFSYALLDALGLDRLKDGVPALPEGAEALAEELERVFASATLAAWEERLKDKDACVTPVRTLAEAAAFLSAGRGRASPRASRPARR